MPKNTSLALIVPCYNEAGSIPFFEAELRDFYEYFCESFPDYSLSVVVVDNNSNDGSWQLLQGLSANSAFVRLERCTTQGYGAALKHGFAVSDSEFIAFLDLDNTYPMKNLVDLLKLIQQKELDIVYGARLHAASDISLIRKSGNLLYVYLLKWLLGSGLSDVCSGMRVFRSASKKEVLALAANDLSFSIELTALALGQKWKIDEFPVDYRDRVGESKLSIVKDGFSFLLVVLKRGLQKSDDRL